LLLQSRNAFPLLPWSIGQLVKTREATRIRAQVFASAWLRSDWLEVATLLASRPPGENIYQPQILIPADDGRPCNGNIQYRS